jgi:hypothetical protein
MAKETAENKIEKLLSYYSKRMNELYAKRKEILADTELSESLKDFYADAYSARITEIQGFILALKYDTY